MHRVAAHRLSWVLATTTWCALACGSPTNLDGVAPAATRMDSGSPSLADAGTEITEGPLPCPNLEGMQSGAFWPTYQGCPSRLGRSNLAGPRGPSACWKVSHGKLDC